MKQRLSVEAYEQGLMNSNRIVLAQAITLVESSLAEDQALANELLDRIVNRAGSSVRIGITGAPGVGKSTFIESLGKHIIASGKKLAVLSVDPSSQLTGGSILGDKTRMEELSRNPLAFIRPSASGNTLGGVAGKTREVILLCEAAGYEVIIVETVGVGQSEVAVKNMVDFFLLLMLAGAGDELQGIKKGIMEMADALVITKADGDNVKSAREAQAEYQHALSLFPLPESGWKPVVLTSSALQQAGIEEVWKTICRYQEETKRSGYFMRNRDLQYIAWFRERTDALIRADFQRLNGLEDVLKSLEQKVLSKKISPNAAAMQLLAAYHEAIRGRRS